jgi:hypothetical protein
LTAIRDAGQVIGFGRQVKAGLSRLLGRREETEDGARPRPKLRPAGLSSRFR